VESILVEAILETNLRNARIALPKVVKSNTSPLEESKVYVILGRTTQRRGEKARTEKSAYIFMRTGPC
jgi:hypothetical protein